VILYMAFSYSTLFEARFLRVRLVPATRSGAIYSFSPRGRPDERRTRHSLSHHPLYFRIDFYMKHTRSCADDFNHLTSTPRPDELPLQPNMIITNEPGYYEAGSFGVRRGFGRIVASEIEAPSLSVNHARRTVILSPQIGFVCVFVFGSFVHAYYRYICGPV
jgi:hypothetical protein